MKSKNSREQNHYMNIWWKCQAFLGRGKKVYFWFSDRISCNASINFWLAAGRVPAAVAFLLRIGSSASLTTWFNWSKWTNRWLGLSLPYLIDPSKTSFTWSGGIPEKLLYQSPNRLLRTGGLKVTLLHDFCTSGEIRYFKNCQASCGCELLLDIIQGSVKVGENRPGAP